jgi:hypothetical protein
VNITVLGCHGPIDPTTFIFFDFGFWLLTLYRFITPVKPFPRVTALTSKQSPSAKISVPSIVDTDKDGLNDAMENILGTNANNPDNDGDGYNDYVEFNGGYNPNGPGMMPNDFEEPIQPQ